MFYKQEVCLVQARHSSEHFILHHFTKCTLLHENITVPKAHFSNEIMCGTPWSTGPHTGQPHRMYTRTLNLIFWLYSMTLSDFQMHRLLLSPPSVHCVLKTRGLWTINSMLPSRLPRQVVTRILFGLKKITLLLCVFT